MEIAHLVTLSRKERLLSFSDKLFELQREVVECIASENRSKKSLTEAIATFQIMVSLLIIQKDINQENIIVSINENIEELTTLAAAPHNVVQLKLVENNHGN